MLSGETRNIVRVKKAKGFLYAAQCYSEIDVSRCWAKQQKVLEQQQRKKKILLYISCLLYSKVDVYIYRPRKK